jgi:hypothetical protein
MKNSIKLIVIVPISVLVGVLLGWFLSGRGDKSSLNVEKDLLSQILTRHTEVKNTLTELDRDTRNLYSKINRTLEECPKAGCNDSIVDLLHHTSAVINKCADMSSRVRDMYELDSIVIDQSKILE